jgi:hypothetical protein
MHLVTCIRPESPLEAAPRTALLTDRGEGEQWDGFWSDGSDEYFVRCTKRDGNVEWFRVADEAAPQTASDGGDTRVLSLRNRARTRVGFVVAQSPDGRRMLVGNAGRNRR